MRKKSLRECLLLIAFIDAHALQLTQIPTPALKRRDFLFISSSTIQSSLTLCNNKPASALPSNSLIDVNSQTLQNYVYNQNWIGTSLSLLSLEMAASTTIQSDFPMGRWPDPILRRSASKIDQEMMGGVLITSVANKLRRTARINRAVGLAAQQW